MAYNHWYEVTYEPILQLAKWNEFNEDVPLKVVSIFSWMPQTIMSIKHSRNQLKHQIYDIEMLINALNIGKGNFYELKALDFLNVNLTEYQSRIEKIVDLLHPIIGTVATSKYLHFSAPKFFPMWDSLIRRSRKLSNNSNGYYQYMESFKKDLNVKK